MIGVASCVFSLLGIIVIKYLGRKVIFVIGNLGMGLSHISAAVCLLNEWYLAAFVSITLFVAFFNLSVGNVTFIYTAEVAVDKAAGIALAF